MEVSSAATLCTHKFHCAKIGKYQILPPAMIISLSARRAPTRAGFLRINARRHLWFRLLKDYSDCIDVLIILEIGIQAPFLLVQCAT